MQAVKEGEEIEFQFRETYTKATRTPTLSKLEKQLRNYSWDSATIDIPKNELCINFGWRSYTNKSFKDTKLRLDYQIEKIVEYIENELIKKIKQRQERLIEKREYERKKYIRQFNESIFQDNLTPSNTGLASAGTYSAAITLRSTNGNAMVLSSAPTGNIANVGFNAGVYSSTSAQYTTAKRSGSTSAPITLTGNDLVINGFTVNAPLSSSDTSTQATTTSANKVSSAISMAAAINALSASTNVIAVANPNLLVGTGFQAGNVDSIYLNGVTIGASLTPSSTVSNVVTLLNQKLGQTGVSASSNGSGVSLVASDGRTISIGASYQGAAVDGATLGMSNLLGSTAPLASADSAMSFISTVTLSSPSAFSVSSGSAGNGNFTALGFKNGTLGASSDLVTLAKQNIQTQSGARNAVNVINAAINWVSNQQAAIGGVLNSMDYQSNYLADSQMNLQISENNLVATDYAQTTTQLAKSQIIQQAATAMLAQANVSSQLVLSLLKH